jgi:hypothetical protein
LYTLLYSSPNTSLVFASNGSILQSPHPVTDLLELRDFWWPHLDLAAYVGIVPLALSTIAIITLVIAAMLYLTVGSTRKLRLDNSPSHRRMLSALLIVGLLLGVGTAGVTGWVIKSIREWPFFGSSILRSITREPGRLASPFIAALAIALALAITSFALEREGSRRKLKTVAIFALLGAACAPSLVAFWGTYRPIQVPLSYGKLSTSIAKGNSLEIAYWPPETTLQTDGVWHFEWSDRAVSDATLLAASVPSPSLSTLEPAVSTLDQQAETEWTTKKGASKMIVLAQKLGITSLVVETDIQLPDSQENC